MSASPDWTEERVRQLLLRARPYADHGTILGAKLGALFRRLDPDFNARVLGDQNLKSLLARFPDVATTEEYEKSLDFVLRFVGSEDSLSRDGRHRTKSSARTFRSLDPELWTALVTENPRVDAYIDLHTLEVVTVPRNIEGEGSDQTSVGQEPERYLRVPPLSQEKLKSEARSFVDTNPELGESRDQLLLLLTKTSSGWFQIFTRALADLGQRTRWLAVHRNFVLGEAAKWLNSHGIDEQKFIHAQSRAKNSTKSDTTEVRRTPDQSLLSERPLSLPRERVRELVQQAVVRMSEEELLNLPIPLRYLIS